MADRKFTVALNTPLWQDSTAGKIRVLISENNQLVFTDEQLLFRFSGQQRVIEHARQQLKLTDSEVELLRETFLSEWHPLAIKIMENTAVGLAQVSAQLLLQDMSEEIKQEAEELLRDPLLIEKIGADLEAMGVAGETWLGLRIYTIGLSRLLAEPLSGLVYGPSGAGKSFIINKVASLTPPEGVLLATQMTPQSLFSADGRHVSLQHVFVVAGERRKREDPTTFDNTRALREMLSTGRLSKLTPKGLIEVEGPIAFVESSTSELSKIFYEDLTRCLALRIDPGKEQTERVLLERARHFSGRAPVTDRERIIKKHWALQRMLLPHRVVIPFAENIAARMTSANPNLITRRVIDQVFATIEAVALLHQFQHADADLDPLVATAREYGIARQLLIAPLKEVLGGNISDEAVALHRRLVQAVGEQTFSTTQVQKWGPRTRKACWQLLTELEGGGSVRKVRGGRGNRPDEWQLTSVDPAKCELLPSAEEVAKVVGTREHMP